LRLLKKYGKPDQRALAAWAGDCAERVLAHFEKACPEDDRPREAMPVFSVQSRIDEIFVFEEARQFVQNARSQGVDVRFETVVGFGHYEATRYIPSLREAEPWIEGIWQEKARR
jgi:hypothetical protein